jgi:uncharacterized protein YjbI with pentapeptide repeats
MSTVTIQTLPSVLGQAIAMGDTLDVSGADLTGADFSELDLTGANFSGCKLGIDYHASGLSTHEIASLIREHRIFVNDRPIDSIEFGRGTSYLISGNRRMTALYDHRLRDATGLQITPTADDAKTISTMKDSRR